MSKRDAEFYVGYVDRCPRGIAIWTRRVAAFLVALAVGVGLVLVTAQARFDFGVFEFGVHKTFEGIVAERPYPMLLVPDGDAPGEVLAHYLVASGKHGAESLVDGMDSRPARITGSLIFNDTERMIEVHHVEPLDGDRGDERGRAAIDAERRLGELTLVGEIVDSKCYLGVMKPGRGKPHKACAIRCISGGVPPVLRVERVDGRVEHFLLVSADGQAVNREVLDMVAEPVEITGTVTRFEDLLILYADPESYRRIGSRGRTPAEEG